MVSHDEGQAIRTISRANLAGDRIAHLRTYKHAPEVLAEICAELGVPHSIGSNSSFEVGAWQAATV